MFSHDPCGFTCSDIAYFHRKPSDSYIQIDTATRIQILDTLTDLPQAEKDQCGAFIRDESCLILWSYALETMIGLCKDFEEKLIKYIWRMRKVARRSGVVSGVPSTIGPSGLGIEVVPASPTGASGEDEIPSASPPSTGDNSPAIPASETSSRVELNEKTGVVTSVVEEVKERPAPPPKREWWSWKLQPQKPATSTGDVDLEKGGEKTKRKERKLVMLGPLYAGLGAGLALCKFCAVSLMRSMVLMMLLTDFVTGGVKVLLTEYALDGDPRRFALLITMPVIYCVSIVSSCPSYPVAMTDLYHFQFFCLQLVGNLTLIFGPVAQYHENSMYYSAIKPEPNPEVDNNLPHITIQLPVYKESLELTMYVLSVVFSDDR